MSILTVDFPYKRGIRRHLEENGITYTNTDGIIEFSNETLALQLIEIYNPLAIVRAEAKVRILAEAAIKVNEIYPHIDAETADVISFYNYTIDMWGGGPLPTRLQNFKDIRDTAITKIAAINIEPDYKIIEAYDATVGW